jgi:hypothetical protein
MYDIHVRLFPPILLLVEWSGLVAAMIDADVWQLCIAQVGE